MAVIITDMKFPKRCLDCQLMGREKMYCQLHPRKNLNVIRVVSERPEWCPLKSTDEMIAEIEELEAHEHDFEGYYECQNDVLGIIHKYCDKENTDDNNNTL